MQPRDIELDREQDLVVMGDLRALPDQLEIGLDDRRPARRQRRIAGVVEPARELVTLRRRGAFDPLQPPDRRVGGGGQDRSPLRQTALLYLGVEQREGERAAGEHGRQQPSAALRQRPQDSTAVLDAHEPDVGQRGAEAPVSASLRRRNRSSGSSSGTGAVRRRRGRRRPSDRSPLLDSAAGEWHRRERHRDSEQQDCRCDPAATADAIEQRDAERERRADGDGLTEAQRAEQPAPLQRSEAVGESLFAHSESSVLPGSD